MFITQSGRQGLLFMAMALVINTVAATDAEADAQQTLPARLPLNELRVFAEAFDRVSSAYVEEIDDRTLLENAIKGMLSQLDPHSAYLDRESFSELQEDTTGNYGGVGLEVSMEDGFVRIIAPMDGTPAERAGVQPGDMIIQLNDQPIKGMSLGEAIEAMRGEPGSTVRLTLIRDGKAQPFEISLTREVIAVASVRQRLLEAGYGYIRIAQFQSHTGTEVEDAVSQLKTEGELLGLVLDLRNNPGGILQSAVAVSNVFMDDGLIVYTAGRLPNADLRFSATSPDAIAGIPIVVLVNEGTASASEIVAGALQDHHRAIIMGTRTFGKGSVQTILPLNNEKAIKLTTALYYTPNGRSIKAEGIVPDIWIDPSTITPAKPNQFSIKEKDLPGHLPNGEHPESTSADVNDSVLATKDYQLHEALVLLKGINILATRTQSPQG